MSGMPASDPAPAAGDRSLTVQIILGSTRRERQGDKVARWVSALVSSRSEFHAELLDLRDWALPFFEGRGSSAITVEWARKVSEADAYIFVTPEYNHSFPAVLKNAMDSAYAEWNRKPAAFVSYSAGAAAGIRAVEQLRLVAVELRMAPVREAVHLPHVSALFDPDGQLLPGAHGRQLDALLEQLQWWARALKTAREIAGASA